MEQLRRPLEKEWESAEAQRGGAVQYRQRDWESFALLGKNARVSSSPSSDIELRHVSQPQRQGQGSLGFGVKEPGKLLTSDLAL